MLQCSCCGARWEEALPFRESRGECFGFPAYEEQLGCPCCGGSLELWEDAFKEDEGNA
ncbi:MAG: hypothetical protein Q4B50_06850 [Bacillota bacterium]|nr:hypothetical protein [Bacillota bacterium]